MKKIIFLLSITISGLTYAQNENIPEGWDQIFLEDKVAYMNANTGEISTSLPKGVARKQAVVNDYQSTLEKVSEYKHTTSTETKYPTRVSSDYQPSYDSRSNSSYIVGKGDTYSKIARNHNMSLSELYRLNSSRSSDQLRIGQEVIVSNNVAANFSSENSHEVTTGETLYGISQIYGISVNELKELNSLNSNAIRIGQRLIVR